MKLEDLVHALHKDRAHTGSAIDEADRTRDLEMILNVVRTINHSLILDEVLHLVLENAIRVTNAERGFLLLQNREGKLECAHACDVSGTLLNTEELPISRSIVDDVFATGESICIENALTDNEYDSRKSIVSLKLQTILASPLVVREEKIGVIYVDSRSIQPVKKDTIVSLFEILAGQAAIAIKNAQLYDKLRTAFAELQQANEQLIKSERMASKGEMAAEISHELKNLVAVVSIQLQSLMRVFHRYSPEESERKLADILQSVKRIAVFSAGLLESSALKTKKQPGIVNATVANLVRFIRPLPKYKHTVLLTDFDETVPEFPFDDQQLQQVLLNFVSNAVEAYSEATVQIRTRYLSGEQRVRIDVSDNGPGIPDEIKKKLFNEKITTKVGGHGYGLSICKKIIENHNGTVDVESNPGHGTTFAISLPVLQP